MTWETYFPTCRFGRDRLPRRPGVYAIYFDEELVYIGQSNNVAARYFGHRIRHGYGKTIITPWGDIPGETHIAVKVKQSRRYGDWAMDEIRLICRLGPKFNRQHLQRRSA